MRALGLPEPLFLFLFVSLSFSRYSPARLLSSDTMRSKETDRRIAGGGRRRQTGGGKGKAGTQVANAKQGRAHGSCRRPEETHRLHSEPYGYKQSIK